VLTARQYGEVVLPDASIRAGSWYFSQKAVTVQRGGACPAVAKRKRGRTFCRPGANFIEHYECRACPAFANQKRGYKFDRSREFIIGYKVGGGHWCSVAVQVLSEPENCHVAGFKLRAGARVRVQVLAGFVMGAGYCKNHDEPINYTVRVRPSFI